MFKIKKIKRFVNWRSPRTHWGLQLSVAILILGVAGAIGGVFRPLVGAVANPPPSNSNNGEGSPVDNPPSNPPPSNPPAAPPSTSWSFEGAYEGTQATPEAPGSGLFSETYAGKVEAEDGEYFTTALSTLDGGSDIQVYRFHISPPSGGGYGDITLHWSGFGEPTPGYLVRAELYNQSTNRWELQQNVQTETLGSNVYLNLTLAENFDSYVGDDGTLWARIFADNVQLDAPANLVAEAVASNETRLSWNDYNSNETGFVVQRKEALTGDWTTVVNLPAGSVAFTDYDASGNGLKPGRQYQYRVKAVAGETESDAATSNAVTMPASGSRKGTTIAVPADAATIQEAANLAQAGDTISVAAGTYSEAVVLRTPNVTIAGAGVGSTIIDVPAGCHAEYCSAIAIEAYSAQTITVQDMTLQHGTGSLVDGRRYGGGIMVLGADVNFRRLAILRNQLQGNDSEGAALALMSPQTVTVDNVVALLNISSGAVIYMGDAAKGVVFKHVTVAENGSEGHDPAVGFWVTDSKGTFDIVNSIFWHNGGAEIASHSDSSVVNVVSSFAGPTATVGSAASGGGGSAARPATLANVKSSNPLMVAVDDPHLQAGSEAIDTGNPSDGTAYDYENHPRGSDAGYDIGASEYVGSKSGGKSGGKTSRVAPAPLARAPQPAPRHASLNTDYVSLEITDLTPPATPTYLSVVSVGDDRVVLQWVDNATNEDGFIVHRVTNGAGDIALAPIASHPSTGIVIFPDYGADLPTGRLSPGTDYCYYVEAYHGSVRSEKSSAACGRTNGSLGHVPHAPSHVTVVGISAGQIRVNWSDDSNDEEGFVLYRRLQGSDDGFSIVNPPAVANATSYVDWGGDTPEGVLQSGSTYCYQVAAYNINGLSDSVPDGGTCAATLLQTWVETFEGGGQSNKAPSLDNLGTLSDIHFGDENDNVELETKLAELFNEDNVYNWQVFAIHLDTSPASLTNLVVNWNGRGESAPNNPVRFSFYNFRTNGWEVQRVFNGGRDDEGDINGNDESGNPNHQFTFTFTSRQLLDTYVRQVQGHDNTLLLWVRARAYIPAPAAPTGLQASDPQPTTVSLKWDDNSSNETGFQVERSSPLGLPVDDWTLVGSPRANETTYSESVPVASSYRYRVRAMRNAIPSAYSNVVNVSTPLYPPYLPYVVPAGSTSITVQWQMNPANGTRYPVASYATEIYRAPGTDPLPGDWTLVKLTGGGQVQYLDGGLSPDTTYSYRLRFLVHDGARDVYSIYGDHVYTKTTAPSVPAAPANLKADAVSTSQINLSWDDVADETGYVLERQVGLTGTWMTAASGIHANDTSYGDTGLVAGQFYQYRLRAVNNAGYSNYSNVASATVFPIPGEQWAQVSTLPTKNGLIQGAAVLASHNGYMFAASNDAAGQGGEEWRHLNIWKSLDAGRNDPWQWVGQTSASVTNNVPVSMVSFNGGLFLLTGSSLWTSVNNGGTWNQIITKGVGDAVSQGFFSHMTVYGGRLYVLFGDGSLQSTAQAAGSWTVHSVPGNMRGLGQYNGWLLAYMLQAPLNDTGTASAKVYRTSDGSLWTILGTVPGEDGFGQCDQFNGLLGLGTRIFSGATAATTDEPCLRVSNDGGSAWARTGGYLNIWSALFNASAAYVASTAVTPDVVSGKINLSNGVTQVVPVTGLGSGYRLWSLVVHGGKRYAAAYRLPGLNPVSPPPTSILSLD